MQRREVPPAPKMPQELATVSPGNHNNYQKKARNREQTRFCRFKVPIPGCSKHPRLKLRCPPWLPVRFRTVPQQLPTNLPRTRTSALRRRRWPRITHVPEASRRGRSRQGASAVRGKALLVDVPSAVLAVSRRERIHRVRLHGRMNDLQPASFNAQKSILLSSPSLCNW